MRRIHKGILKWEDIEVEAQSNDQNFLPESLIQNSANRIQTNSTDQGSNLIKNNVNNNMSNNTFFNGTNNNINNHNDNNSENLVRNINFNEINKNSDPNQATKIMEDFEEEDVDYVPAEVMNAPDFDTPGDDDEYDENLDISYLDLERKIKKLKPNSSVDDEEEK